MKLYEFPPTRSIRARWTLQELGVDFQSITVNLLKGEHRSAQFLAVNPAGKVPVLVDDGRVVTESVAIVLYLAEKYPDRKLIPTDPGEREELFRWLMFAVTELEAATRGSIPKPNANRRTWRSRAASLGRWRRCWNATWTGGSSSPGAA